MLAHGVWLDEAELELIAERGCTVVAAPVANMKLAVGGVLPYPAARRAGVAVGLGTDGAGSNDSLDLFSDLKTFALMQRHVSGDAAALPAKEAWQIATGARAPLLTGRPPNAHQVQGEMAPEVDALRVGGPADFLLLRRDSPELSLGDLRVGPRLRRQRLDRRHHGGRRPGADARRPGGGQRGGCRARRRAGAAARGRLTF